jgi:phosphoribosylanthranilate isomerase
MIVKVCGIANPEIIHRIDEIPIDLIGFIFYPASKRFVKNKLQASLIKSIPEHIKKVGVFVNEEKEPMLETAKKYQLDFVQLHGDESAAFVEEISQEIEVIKAFSLSSHFNFSKLADYESLCKYFLFDTKDKLYGGTGKKFNWDLLKKYKGKTPFLLSGGIMPFDAESIKQLNHPMLAGIDINSGFETEPGKKNIQQIQLFINQLI